jgi:cell division FtsZ-interacting protein ZapD
VDELTSSPKCQNAEIDEVLKGLEHVEEITEDKVKQALYDAADRNGVDRSQIEAVVERTCAEMRKDSKGKMQRCDLRKKLESQKGEFDKLFGDMQAEKSPADQVMQQLEYSGNGTIRPRDVSQAILESARLNQK